MSRYAALCDDLDDLDEEQGGYHGSQDPRGAVEQEEQKVDPAIPPGASERAFEPSSAHQQRRARGKDASSDDVMDVEDAADDEHSAGTDDLVARERALATEWDPVESPRRVYGVSPRSPRRTFEEEKAGEAAPSAAGVDLGDDPSSCMATVHLIRRSRDGKQDVASNAFQVLRLPFGASASLMEVEVARVQLRGKTKSLAHKDRVEKAFFLEPSTFGATLDEWASPLVPNELGNASEDQRLVQATYDLASKAVGAGAAAAFITWPSCYDKAPRPSAAFMDFIRRQMQAGAFKEYPQQGAPVFLISTESAETLRSQLQTAKRGKLGHAVILHEGASLVHPASGPQGPQQASDSVPASSGSRWYQFRWVADHLPTFGSLWPKSAERSPTPLSSILNIVAAMAMSGLEGRAHGDVAAAGPALDESLIQWTASFVATELGPSFTEINAKGGGDAQASIVLDAFHAAGAIDDFLSSCTACVHAAMLLPLFAVVPFQLGLCIRATHKQLYHRNISDVATRSAVMLARDAVAAGPELLETIIQEWASRPDATFPPLAIVKRYGTADLRGGLAPVDNSEPVHVLTALSNVLRRAVNPFEMYRTATFLRPGGYDVAFYVDVLRAIHATALGSRDLPGRKAPLEGAWRALLKEVSDANIDDMQARLASSDLTSDHGSIAAVDLAHVVTFHCDAAKPSPLSFQNMLRLFQAIKNQSPTPPQNDKVLRDELARLLRRETNAGDEMFGRHLDALLEWARLGADDGAFVAPCACAVVKQWSPVKIGELHVATNNFSIVARGLLAGLPPAATTMLLSDIDDTVAASLQTRDVGQPPACLPDEAAQHLLRGHPVLLSSNGVLKYLRGWTELLRDATDAYIPMLLDWARFFAMAAEAHPGLWVSQEHMDQLGDLLGALRDRIHGFQQQPTGKGRRTASLRTMPQSDLMVLLGGLLEAAAALRLGQGKVPNLTFAFWTTIPGPARRRVPESQIGLCFAGVVRRLEDRASLHTGEQLRGIGPDTAFAVTTVEFSNVVQALDPGQKAAVLKKIQHFHGVSPIAAALVCRLIQTLTAECPASIERLPHLPDALQEAVELVQSAPSASTNVPPSFGCDAWHSEWRSVLEAFINGFQELTGVCMRMLHELLDHRGHGTPTLQALRHAAEAFAPALNRKLPTLADLRVLRSLGQDLVDNLRSRLTIGSTGHGDWSVSVAELMAAHQVDMSDPLHDGTSRSLGDLVRGVDDVDSISLHELETMMQDLETWLRLEVTEDTAQEGANAPHPGESPADLHSLLDLLHYFWNPDRPRQGRSVLFHGYLERGLRQAIEEGGGEALSVARFFSVVQAIRGKIRSLLRDPRLRDVMRARDVLGSADHHREVQIISRCSHFQDGAEQPAADLAHALDCMLDFAAIMKTVPAVLTSLEALGYAWVATDPHVAGLLRMVETEGLDGPNGHEDVDVQTADRIRSQFRNTFGSVSFEALDVLPRLVNVGELWHLVAEMAFDSPDGLRQMGQQLEHISTVMQGQRFDEDLFANARGALAVVARIATCRHPASNFAALVEVLEELGDSVPRVLRMGYMEEANRSIAKVRRWFSACDGDLLAQKLWDFLDTGRYIFRFSEGTGGAARPTFLLQYEHRSSPVDDARGGAVAMNDEEESFDALQEIATMLSFTQHDNEQQGDAIRFFLDQYGDMVIAFKGMAELSALGHPDFLGEKRVPLFFHHGFRYTDASGADRQARCAAQRVRDATFLRGISDALAERQRVMSSHFHDYPLLKCFSMPEILYVAKLLFVDPVLQDEGKRAIAVVVGRFSLDGELPAKIVNVAQELRLRLGQDEPATLAVGLLLDQLYDTCTAWTPRILPDAAATPTPGPLRTETSSSFRVHEAPGLDLDELLRVTLHIFSPRLPERFEMLFCRPTTAVSELGDFMERVSDPAFRERRFLLFRFERLPTVLQERVLDAQLRTHEENLLSSTAVAPRATLHCLQSRSSVLRELSAGRHAVWCKHDVHSQRIYKAVGAGCLRTGAIRDVRLVAGPPGSGKTHYARKRLRRPNGNGQRSLVIELALNEGFCADAICDRISDAICQHGAKDLALFFNISLGLFTDEELSAWTALMDDLNSFFMELLVFQTMRNERSGRSVNIPSDAAWRIIIELPCRGAHFAPGGATSARTAAALSEEGAPAAAILADIPILRAFEANTVLRGYADPYDVASDEIVAFKYLDANFEYQEHGQDPNIGARDAMHINRRYLGDDDIHRSETLTCMSARARPSPEACNALLTHFLGECTPKALQKKFMRGILRRVHVLERFPAYQYNSHLHQRTGQSDPSGHASQLGSELFAIMLAECRLDIDPAFRRDWRSTELRKLVYENNGGAYSIGLITTKPEEITPEEREKYWALGVDINGVTPEALVAQELLPGRQEKFAPATRILRRLRNGGSAVSFPGSDGTLDLVQDIEKANLGKRATMDGFIARALSLRLAPGSRLEALDAQRFVMTLDFFVKLLTLNDALDSRAPLIVQGETGVGKTFLLRMLSILRNQRRIRERTQPTEAIESALRSCFSLPDWQPDVPPAQPEAPGLPVPPTPLTPRLFNAAILEFALERCSATEWDIFLRNVQADVAVCWTEDLAEAMRRFYESLTALWDAANFPDAIRPSTVSSFCGKAWDAFSTLQKDRVAAWHTGVAQCVTDHVTVTAAVFAADEGAQENKGDDGDDLMGALSLALGKLKFGDVGEEDHVAALAVRRVLGLDAARRGSLDLLRSIGNAVLDSVRSSPLLCVSSRALEAAEQELGLEDDELKARWAQSARQADPHAEGVHENGIEYFGVDLASTTCPVGILRLMDEALGAKEQSSFCRINVHGALSAADVADAFDAPIALAERVAKLEQARRQDAETPDVDAATTVTVFLDEFNTSSAMGLMKELLQDHSLLGRPLPPNLKVIAACNPKRHRRVKDIGRQGLGLQDEYTMGSYQVHGLPTSLEMLVWDYGALSPKQEEEYTYALMEVATGQHQDDLSRRHELRQSVPSTPEVLVFARQLSEGVAEHLFGNEGEPGRDSSQERRDDRTLAVLREREFISSLVAHHAGVVVGKLAAAIATAQHVVRAIAEKELHDASRVTLGAGHRMSRAEIEARAASEVSQRDIQRCFKVYRHLLGLMTGTNYRLIGEGTNNALSDEHGFGAARKEALAVAIGVVYYLRLSEADREQFLNEPKFGSDQYNVKGCLEHAMDEVLRDMEARGRGIAFNAALRENIFATIVCSMARLPLMLIGPPGSGKTLSFDQVVSSLRGKESDIAFFRQDVFPALEPHYYQCSRRSTSKQIAAVFERATFRQARLELSDSRSAQIILVDEAGLPEERRESLKVLHFYLEQPQVGFVAISNHKPDAAKANRAVVCRRSAARPQELEDIGDAVGSGLGRSLVRGLCEAYNDMLEDGRAPWFRTFFGHRDLIHCFRALHRLQQAEGITTANHLLRALERNFSGADAAETMEVQRHFLVSSGLLEQAADITGLLETHRRSVVAVLRDALEDRATPGEDEALADVLSRPKLLIDESDDDSLLRRLFRFHLLDRARTRLFKVSNFPEMDEVDKAGIVAGVKHAASMGDTVVLSQTESLNESFYDLLNQHFREMRGRNGSRRFYANVAMGAHSHRSEVKPTFQCIVIVRKTDLADVPAPFLNRFEKYRIGQADLLQEGMGLLAPPLAGVVDAARARLHTFVEAFGVQGLYGAMPGATVDSIVLDMLSVDGPQDPAFQAGAMHTRASASPLAFPAGHAAVPEEAGIGGAEETKGDVPDASESVAAEKTGGELDREEARDADAAFSVHLLLAAREFAESRCGLHLRIASSPVELEAGAALVASQLRDAQLWDQEQHALETDPAVLALWLASALRALGRASGVGVTGTSVSEGAKRFAMAVLLDVLVLPAQSRLLQIATPEALLGCQNGIVQDVRRHHLLARSRLHVPALLATALESDTRLVLAFTRSSAQLHQLPAHFGHTHLRQAHNAGVHEEVHEEEDKEEEEEGEDPWAADGPDGDEDAPGSSRTEEACAAMLWHRTEELCLHKLHGFGSQGEFLQALDAFLHHPEKSVFILVANMSAQGQGLAEPADDDLVGPGFARAPGAPESPLKALQQRVNYVRLMMEERMLGLHPSVPKVAGIILHFPSDGMYRVPCYPALFATAWHMVFLDEISAPNTLATTLFQRCFAGPLSAGEKGELLPVQDVTDLMELVPEVALAFASKYSSLQPSAFARRHAKLRNFLLGVRLPSGQTVGALVCRRFSELWQPATAVAQLRRAAADLRDGLCSLSLRGTLEAHFSTDFHSFMSWMLELLLHHGVPRLLRDADSGDALQLFESALTALTLPPLEELRLQTGRDVDAFQMWQRCDVVQIFPFFNLVSEVLQRAVDEAIVGAHHCDLEEDFIVLGGAADALGTAAAMLRNVEHEPLLRGICEAADERDAVFELYVVAFAKRLCAGMAGAGTLELIVGELVSRSCGMEVGDEKPNRLLRLHLLAEDRRGQWRRAALALAPVADLIGGSGDAQGQLRVLMKYVEDHAGDMREEMSLDGVWSHVAPLIWRRFQAMARAYLAGEDAGDEGRDLLAWVRMAHGLHAHPPPLLTDAEAERQVQRVMLVSVLTLELGHHLEGLRPVFEMLTTDAAPDVASPSALMKVFDALHALGSAETRAAATEAMLESWLLRRCRGVEDSLEVGPDGRRGARRPQRQNFQEGAGERLRADERLVLGILNDADRPISLARRAYFLGLLRRGAGVESDAMLNEVLSTTPCATVYVPMWMRRDRAADQNEVEGGVVEPQYLDRGGDGALEAPLADALYEVLRREALDGYGATMGMADATERAADMARPGRGAVQLVKAAVAMDVLVHTLARCLHSNYGANLPRVRLFDGRDATARLGELQSLLSDEQHGGRRRRAYAFATVSLLQDRMVGDRDELVKAAQEHPRIFCGEALPTLSPLFEAMRQRADAGDAAQQGTTLACQPSFMTTERDSAMGQLYATLQPLVARGDAAAVAAIHHHLGTHAGNPLDRPFVLFMAVYWERFDVGLDPTTPLTAALEPNGALAAALSLTPEESSVFLAFAARRCVVNQEAYAIQGAHLQIRSIQHHAPEGAPANAGRLGQGQCGDAARELFVFDAAGRDALGEGELQMRHCVAAIVGSVLGSAPSNPLRLHLLSPRNISGSHPLGSQYTFRVDGMVHFDCGMDLHDDGTGGRPDYRRTELPLQAMHVAMLLGYAPILVALFAIPGTYEQLQGPIFSSWMPVNVHLRERIRRTFLLQHELHGLSAPRRAALIVDVAQRLRVQSLASPGGPEMRRFASSLARAAFEKDFMAGAFAPALRDVRAREAALESLLRLRDVLATASQWNRRFPRHIPRDALGSRALNAATDGRGNFAAVRLLLERGAGMRLSLLIPDVVEVYGWLHQSLTGLVTRPQAKKFTVRDVLAKAARSRRWPRATIARLNRVWRRLCFLWSKFRAAHPHGIGAGGACGEAAEQAAGRREGGAVGVAEEAAAGGAAAAGEDAAANRLVKVVELSDATPLQALLTVGDEPEEGGQLLLVLGKLLRDYHGNAALLAKEHDAEEDGPANTGDAPTAEAATPGVPLHFVSPQQLFLGGLSETETRRFRCAEDEGEWSEIFEAVVHFKGALGTLLVGRLSGDECDSEGLARDVHRTFLLHRARRLAPGLESIRRRFVFRDDSPGAAGRNGDDPEGDAAGVERLRTQLVVAAERELAGMQDELEILLRPEELDCLRAAWGGLDESVAMRLLRAFCNLHRFTGGMDPECRIGDILQRPEAEGSTAPAYSLEELLPGDTDARLLLSLPRRCLQPASAALVDDLRAGWFSMASLPPTVKARIDEAARARLRALPWFYRDAGSRQDQCREDLAELENILIEYRVHITSDPHADLKGDLLVDVFGYDARELPLSAFPDGIRAMHYVDLRCELRRLALDQGDPAKDAARLLDAGWVARWMGGGDGLGRELVERCQDATRRAARSGMLQTEAGLAPLAMDEPAGDAEGRPAAWRHGVDPDRADATWIDEVGSDEDNGGGDEPNRVAERVAVLRQAFMARRIQRFFQKLTEDSRASRARDYCMAVMWGLLRILERQGKRQVRNAMAHWKLVDHTAARRLQEEKIRRGQQKLAALVLRWLRASRHRLQLHTAAAQGALNDERGPQEEPKAHAGGTEASRVESLPPPPLDAQSFSELRAESPTLASEVEQWMAGRMPAEEEERAIVEHPERRGACARILAGLGVSTVSDLRHLYEASNYDIGNLAGSMLALERVSLRDALVRSIAADFLAILMGLDGPGLNVKSATAVAHFALREYEEDSLLEDLLEHAREEDGRSLQEDLKQAEVKSRTAWKLVKWCRQQDGAGGV